jgi:NAD(P)-dependent dehydrogenase (short-subunit alcohol dehydrogenase family)/acyl dehydratase/putative sterol carrier protein
MALKIEAVGKKLGPFTKQYTWKDAVLYAMGVGAGFDDLEYCYEKDLKVIPSFSIAAIFDFLSHVGIESNVNLAGILHGEQELIFHNPIPPEGTLTTEGQITHYYDKGEGKGALVVAESNTHHANGQKLYTSIMTVFGRLDGGFGGENAPKKEIRFPDRGPDFVVTAATMPNQPLLYRLSGDVFQLHVDSDFAKASGFKKPIMHGLCSHGFACRALIKSLIPGLPEKARRMACRFSKPLYPGDPIETRIWKTEDGKALWRVVNGKTGDVVIDNGEFEYGEIPRDEIRFDGKVAVITGAGAGLGRIYALELAKRGAKVVVNDFGGARDGSGRGSFSPAQEVVNEIKALGGQAVPNYDNVATREGGENIVKTALDSFGTVDILINNAGILRDRSFLKMESEDWHAVLDVHLHGAFNVTRPAFNVMKQNGFGRIIMTTSAAGLYGNFGQSNYAAAKMALVGFMNSLKIEGDKYGIKVNTVAPIAASRLTEDILPPTLLKKSSPEFVAPLVLYLASDRCPVSGRIYNVGMGLFNRAAVVTGPGTVLACGEKIPTAEDLLNIWDKVTTLEGGKEYSQLNDLVGDIMNAFTKPSGNIKKEASGLQSVAEVFAAMPKAFVAGAAAGADVVFQYNISGKNGGNWYCAIKNNVCNITAGTHQSPGCTFNMADADFLAMMTGTLPAMQAFTSGKLQITGDVMKSQLIEKLFKL